MSDWKKYKNGCFELFFSNYQALILELKKTFKINNNILFRGHSNKDYRLISCIDRHYYDYLKKFDYELKDFTGGEQPEPFSRNEYIQFHLTQFRKKLAGKVDSEIYFKDDEKAWALGQHYGLWTPYLDWTESPLIASFFCCIDNKDLDGCVYALDLQLVEQINKLINEPEKKLNIKHPYTNFNTRLNSQNGCFTELSNGIAIDDWISSFKEFENKPVLKKIIISQEIKYQMLEYLEMANINYASIYPDLEGISKYINHKTEETAVFVVIDRLLKQAEELTQREEENERK